jgi:hypothetical protein
VVLGLQQIAAGIGGQHGGAPGCAHVLADPGDEHGHLVRDQAEVGVARGDHGQAGALTGGRDEQEGRLHLDHGLAHRAGPEVPARTLGQTLEAGRHRRQVLGVLPIQPGRRSHEEPVGGEHDRLLRRGHPLHQIVEEPGEVRALVRRLCHLCVLFRPDDVFAPGIVGAVFPRIRPAPG